MALKDLIPWKGSSETGTQVASPFDRMREEMDRVFDRLASDFWNRPSFPGWGGHDNGWREWAPAVDVVEKDDSVCVHAEVAGVDPKDIEVSLNGDVLTISGKKEEKFEKTEKGVHHAECRYGSFRRNIQLPAGIDPQSIEAEHKNGVLSVKVKRTEVAQPRKIAIKSQ